MPQQVFYTEPYFMHVFFREKQTVIHFNCKTVVFAEEDPKYPVLFLF